MNSRISIALAGILLAAFGLFATAPQTQPKANPAEAARLNNLGAAYMNQQLFEKALKCFQQAAELDPKLTIARLNEGIAFLNLQKIDEAKAALEEALKLDPKNPQAWYNLGLYAKNAGDAQAATEAFRHVAEIDPNDADTWYFLGTAYVQAKQFPQAVQAFQHALQINPLHASAEFGMSRAYQQSGEIDHAREHLKKFQYITQNKIGAPMSLAYGEQGQYSRAVEAPSALLKAPAQIKVRFVDVTKKAGLPTEPIESSLDVGACFIDYDGDGRADLFLAASRTNGRPSLLHNLGNGTFQDATPKLALDPSLRVHGCTAGDYDNDGFQDLAITAADGVHLLHNENGEKLSDATVSAGIISDRTAGSALVVWTALNFVDYDHDGDLDLIGIRQAWLPVAGSEANPSPLPSQM
jgi:tetratricopeptide (TPR) repeat protein